jgi:hypothetical protein
MTNLGFLEDEAKSRGTEIVYKDERPIDKKRLYDADDDYDEILWYADR